MLTILRRVFNFQDHELNHPGEPIPANMLDASFDAQNQRIAELEALIESIRRSDGALNNGIVTKDSLDPAFFHDLSAKIAKIGDLVLEQTQKSAQIAENAAKTALFAQTSAEDARKEAIHARDDLLPLRSDLSAGFALIEASKSSLEGRFAPLAAQMSVRADEVESYAGESEAWADSSRLWAEHMPDTLPDNALKMMDITGDHWSARWWANRAANAFGRLQDLYLGAHPTPPLTNLTGGPIEPGSIYYNTTTNEFYTWTGSAWVSMSHPVATPTAATSLVYTAGASQTVFSLLTPDLDGKMWGMNAAAPEPLGVHVNGLKMVKDVPGAVGDYTVDAATSTVTFLAPVPAAATVLFDIYASPSSLGSGGVNAYALKDIDLDPVTGLPGTQDGIRTTFTLKAKDTTVTVAVVRSEELLVSVDGIPQEPGVAYSAAGDQLTFTTAPEADAYVFITWFKANANLDPGGDKYLKSEADARFANVSGDTMTGPLVLFGNPVAALDAVPKQYADARGDWANITNKPATFPPTLPIAQSGITNLPADLATLNAAIAAETSARQAGDNTLTTADAGKVAKAGDTMTGKFTAAASTAARAGINIGGASAGVSPSAPVDGDIWATGGFRLDARLGSTDYTFAFLNQNQTYTGILSFNGKVIHAASAAGGAKFMLLPGAAPSAPVNGDMWTTSTGLYVQIAGATVGPLVSGITEAPNDGKPYARNSLGWDDLTNDFAAKANVIHTHPQSEVLNLQNDLAAKADAAATTSALAGKLSLSGGTMTGKLTGVLTGSAAGINIGHGTNPSTPVNGDIWTTSAGSLNYFANGVLLAAVNTTTAQSISGTKTFNTAASFAAGFSAQGAIALSGTATVTYSGTADFTFTQGRLALMASTAAKAPLNIPTSGAIVSAPFAGDIWATASGLFMRVGTSTRNCSIAVGTTAPSSPAAGDLWVDTN